MKIKLAVDVLRQARVESVTPGQDVRNGSAAGMAHGKAMDLEADRFFAAMGRAVYFAATHEGDGVVDMSLIDSMR